MMYVLRKYVYIRSYTVCIHYTCKAVCDIKFLHLVSQDDYLSQHFTESCVKICNDALEVLTVTAEKLKQGKVKVKELDLLSSNSKQVKNLLSPQVAEKVTKDPSFSILDIIAEKNSEVQRFESYCSRVKTLLEYCESIADGMHYK